LLDLFRFLELFEISNVEAVDGSPCLGYARMRVRGQPSVLKSLTCCHTSLRTGNKLTNQVLSLGSDVVPFLAIIIKVATRDHLQNLLVVVTIKRRVSAKENVEHAARGPHVTGDVVVAGKYFRRNVVRSAGTSLHTMEFAALHDLGETEVNDLQVCVFFGAHKQEVLRLEVTMNDIHGVAVVEGLEDLFEDFRGHLFTEKLILNDTIEKFTACAYPIRSEMLVTKIT